MLTTDRPAIGGAVLEICRVLRNMVYSNYDTVIFNNP